MFLRREVRLQYGIGEFLLVEKALSNEFRMKLLGQWEKVISAIPSAHKTLNGISINVLNKILTCNSVKE